MFARVSVTFCWTDFQTIGEVQHWKILEMDAFRRNATVRAQYVNSNLEIHSRVKKSLVKPSLFLSILKYHRLESQPRNL